MSTEGSTGPKGPYKLVTVNTAPERARRLIGQAVEKLSDRYTIIHVANCELMEEVGSTVEKEQPDLLFVASVWTPEQSSEIFSVAREKVPNLKTHAIPQELQVDKGPDAVVEHLLAEIPKLLG